MLTLQLALAHAPQVVKQLFGKFVPTEIKPDRNATWFVSFESEQAAQDVWQRLAVCHF